MNALATLQEALSVLRVEGAWHRPCSGAWFATTASGDGCDPSRPDAARWTVIGAISRSGKTHAEARARLIDALPADARGSIIAWELASGRTQDAVIALFERAVRLTPSGGSL